MGFLRAVDRGLDRFYGFCGYLAAAFLVLLGLLVVTSIVSRLFSTYLPGVNAYAGYAMAGCSFLALAYTFRENGHIRVALILSHLRGGARKALLLWGFGIGSLIAVYFAFYLVKMTLISWRFGDLSEGADATPLWIPQLIMAFGAIAFAICIIHNAVRFLAKGEAKDVAGTESGAAIE